MLIVSLSLKLTQCDGDSLDLKQKLESFMREKLGVQMMQDHLDSLSFSRTPVNPDELLKSVSESLSKKFKEQISVVEKMRDKIEYHWESLPSKSTQPSESTAKNPVFKVKDSRTRSTSQINS